MTFVVENKDSFLLVTRDLSFVEDDREMAAQWSQRHVQKNPAIRWVLGKYVEADNANSNKQFWSLKDLQLAHTTVNNAPLNILHRPQYIVGTFVATEMIYPIEAQAGVDGEIQRPYVEALAAFWRYYFPDELKVLEAAHNAGTAALSMECVGEEMTCAGDTGCGQTFAYKGPKHESYCKHLNEGSSIRHIKEPHFLAGALIFPPSKPGWGGASIKEISNGTDEQFMESVYASLAAEIPEGNTSDWESLMSQLILQFQGSKAEKMAKMKKPPKKIAQEMKKKMNVPY